MATAATAILSQSLKTDIAPVSETSETAATMARTSAGTAAVAAVMAASRTGSETRVSKAALATKLLSLSGVFAVHKPKGPTSAELLNRLKEKLLAEAGMPSSEWSKRKKQTLKIGHGGTLDSAAGGVLVIGIGRGTKMLTSMLSGSKDTEADLLLEMSSNICCDYSGSLKRYIAIGELGKATDTQDSTGKVTEEKPYDKITQEDIEGILQKFTGNIMQVPPLYSALKKDGQRLSTLMKRGEVVEAKPARPVTVYSISLQKFQPPFFTLDVECGGGFYIRSLVSDIGKGPDCSLNVPSTESYWILPNVKPFSPSVGRASHKAVLHGKFMWVIGGYTFNYSTFQMVLNYNLESSIWNVGTLLRGPLQRYGHSLALYQENIFMYGGRIETNYGNVTDELWVFNIHSQSWSTKTPTVLGHGQQYAVEGHSAHIMELDSRDVVMIIVFGYSAIYGYTSSIQEYHISSNTWLVPETKGAIVQGGYGHTSVYDEITKSIYVHGGYKALPGNKYGLVDDLYKYEVNTKTWTILKESGFARYLHSAVLINGAMLIFGGNTHNDTSLSNGAKCFSADFLAYDIACDEWKILPKPNLHRDVNRFGHSAVVINGSMYIFGGFSSVLLNDILVYKPPNCKAFRDEEFCKNAGPGIKCVWNKSHCESWESGNTNNILRAKCPPRTAISDDRCHRYADCASCTANTNGCQWCEDKKCISANSNCSMSVRNYTKCHVRNEQICNKLTSCKSCSLNLNCQWDQRQQECQALPAHLCGEGWSHIGDACLRINSSRESYDNAKLYCYNLSGNLASLTTSKEVEFVLDEIQKYTQQKVSPWVGLRKINISYWGWEDMSPFTNTTLQWLPGEPNDSGFCAYLERAAVAGLKANPCTSMADGLVCEKPVVSPNQNARPCKKPCSLRTSCSNCTSNGMECMWCSSTKRCVDSNAYIISFPYGQCLEWQTATCSPQNCSGLRTCGQCLEQPGCGWCNDPSNTGRGRCIEGSSRGPMKLVGIHNNEMILDTNLCPKEKNYEWSFIQCPACQCNGHSICINNNICEQCKNLTTGKQCQDCMPGYYGDPTNGGQCTACTCSGHANICHLHTGKCFCTTKGIKGDQCQLCDSENRYVGNPLRGTCYYSLLIDYQFTFSLLQEDDRHHTAINFIANPEQSNKNLDISINASNNFNLNITWSVGSTAGTISGEETPIISRTNIKEYRDSFSYEKFNFRNNPNITFYVYVSNFSWPIKIQVSVKNIYF
ncbi:Attractin-like protein 1 [Fukomys damarensis]|uniref:tRNA pseudouridine(55) synthase n=1 Tax=Fukomys damarensis TaxID=885580 RepID=A0A091DEN3_FUKDA|nr:Attractin-like protein 1 [Fukomys damarensis]